LALIAAAFGRYRSWKAARMLNGISNLISGQTGINSGQLVDDLVSAARAGRDQQLRQKLSLNQSRISAIGSARSALSTFSKALSELLDGRGFAGELVSSRSDIVSVGFVDGARPQGLPATIEVNQLAAAQRLVSGVYATGDAPVGEGTLTLDTPQGSFAITIDASNNSLGGLRDAINASGSGVTATILTDKTGARLVIEGTEGADNGFTLTGGGSGTGLDAFAYPAAGGGGLSLVSAAADSIITVDGIQLVNTGNTIDNAITGVSLSLLTAVPGTKVTVSGDKPTTTIKNLVVEFTDAYNDLRNALNSATAPGTDGASGGPLAGERAVREMKAALARITSTPLAASGDYRTLADIGVRTNRDGTLAVDTVRLDAVLAADPEGVARLLEPTVADANNPGIAGALKAIEDSLDGDTGSLSIAQKKFEAIAKTISEAMEKVDEDSERYRAQLSTAFAAMDRQLAILRSTQSYLDQQVEVWNNNYRNN